MNKRWAGWSVAALLTVCVVGALGTRPAAPARAASGTVSVLYAGSLVAVNEHKVGPAFTQATGYTYQGEGGGSVALANLIKGRVKTPDVFESADPAVNTVNLAGAKNGNYVSWYFVFARTRLVIGFNPRSRFAHALQDAQAGRIPWYEVLTRPGIRIGRTDPLLDPKGYRTLLMAQLAARYYHFIGLEQRIFGAAENTAQIFPEQTLVARLQTGQLDAGVFYLNEAVEQHLPYINLPSAIDLGEPAYAATYKTARVVTPDGKAHVGAPILYTVTIPRTVRDEAGAEAFVRFVVSGAGLRLYEADGVLPATLLVGGNVAAVPSSLSTLAHGRVAG